MTDWKVGATTFVRSVPSLSPAASRSPAARQPLASRSPAARQPLASRSPAARQPRARVMDVHHPSDMQSCTHGHAGGIAMTKSDGSNGCSSGRLRRGERGNSHVPRPGLNSKTILRSQKNVCILSGSCFRGQRSGWLPLGGERGSDLGAGDQCLALDRPRSTPRLSKSRCKNKESLGKRKNKKSLSTCKNKSKHLQVIYNIRKQPRSFFKTSLPP